jgi:uncharacterized membrane protein YbhN (UPF0104 family)
MPSKLKHRLLRLAKLLAGSAVVAFLLWQATRGEQAQQLLHGEKNWWMFLAAAGCIFCAVVINFFRWWLLVHAAGLSMTIAEALRLGALGHAANFVGPGSVGGDLLKAVLFARSRAGKRSAAVATVLVDRFLGLLTLLALAAVSAGYALAAGLLDEKPVMAGICRTVMAAAAMGWGVAALALLPGPHARFIDHWLRRMPGAGRTLSELFVAVQRMHRHPASLPGAMACSTVSHVLLVLSFVFVGWGLPIVPPGLAESFAAIPLAELAGAVPLFPGGLGATEGALEALYQALGASRGAGLFVALGQRLVNISVGAVAMFYYLAHRRELAPAVAEAGELTDA